MAVARTFPACQRAFVGPTDPRARPCLEIGTSSSAPRSCAPSGRASSACSAPLLLLLRAVRGLRGAIGLLFFGARVANTVSHFGAAWIAARIGLVPNLVRLGGWAVAPAFAGALMQGGSLGTPLLVGAAMKILYDVALFLSFKEQRPPEEATR